MWVIDYSVKVSFVSVDGTIWTRVFLGESHATR